jgi:hypothetical protein
MRLSQRSQEGVSGSGHTGDFGFLSYPSLSSGSGVEFIGRKSMKRLLADKWQTQILKEIDLSGNLELSCIP